MFSSIILEPPHTLHISGQPLICPSIFLSSFDFDIVMCFILYFILPTALVKVCKRVRPELWIWMSGNKVQNSIKDTFDFSLVKFHPLFKCYSPSDLLTVPIHKNLKL